MPDLEPEPKTRGSDEARARYVMVGGFLGAGKTTAILRLARFLTDRGRRGGLITNDQSVGLVAAALARAEGLTAHARAVELRLEGR